MNTEIVKCKVCGKEFERYSKNKKNNHAIKNRIVRPGYAKTCSTKCSRIKERR